jgi:hypothetical protein
MPIDIQSSLDFGGVRRVLNLPDAIGPQQPATLAQLQAMVKGLSWKDNVRVATVGNINLASPGVTIDGITLVAGDRVLVLAQTTPAHNGIYIWNGAAVVMTRSGDSSTSDDLESAVVSVDEGTSAVSSYRQQTVNFVLDTGNVVWGEFGTVAPPATDLNLGLIEIATQSEVNAGADAVRAVAAVTLSNSVFATRKLVQNFGDGSATSYAITHNFNTHDVMVEVFRNSGNRDSVLIEVQRTSLNVITLLTESAPSANAFRVLVRS